MLTGRTEDLQSRKRLGVLDLARSIDQRQLPRRYDRRDRFELNVGVSLSSQSVTDASTGLRLELDPLGLAVAALIGRGLELGSVADAVSGKYDLPRRDAWSRVVAYVQALDHNLMLKRSSGMKARFTGRTLTAHMSTLAIFPRSGLDWIATERGGSNYRFQPTLSGLTRAVARTQWMFPIAGLATALLVLGVVMVTLGAGAVQSRAQLQAIVLAPFLIGILHCMLIWLHEAGHLLMARHKDVGSGSPLFVVARGKKLGVLRRPSERRRDEIFIILAGPFAAAAGGVLSAGLLHLGDSTGLLPSADYALASVSLVLAAAHLLSLSPFAGDGQNLRRALKL